MNVLAINGSPHMDEGNTAMILNPFLEGLKEAGASVELFYTRKLKIGPCNGDMSCWFKNPGKCGQDDDMQMLLPKPSPAALNNTQHRTQRQSSWSTSHVLASLIT